MNKPEIRKLISIFGPIMRCPVCGSRCGIANSTVAEVQQGNEECTSRVVVHSECARCKGSVIFNLGFIGHDMFSSATRTDLTSEDVIKFSKLHQFSSADVLDFREFIDTFNGDFAVYFGRQ